MRLLPRLPRVPNGVLGLVVALIVLPIVVLWFLVHVLYVGTAAAVAATAQAMARSTNPATHRRGELLLRVQRQVTFAAVVSLLGIAVAVSSVATSSDPPDPPPSTAASPTSTAPPPSIKPETSPSLAIPTVAATSPSTPAIGRREHAALDRLDQLKVDDRINPAATYRRDAFGSGWIDTDRNGCNQRDDVLLRDAVPGTVKVAWQGRCDHDVLAGTWIDPYTGRKVVLTDIKEIHQSMAIQIDHIVPLSEAWVSGASDWSKDRRRAFANDLDELLAVDGPTNQSKSDHDPAEWRPRKDFQCAYAERWIGIKLLWRLTADASELRALREMLTYC